MVNSFDKQKYLHCTEWPLSKNQLYQKSFVKFYVNNILFNETLILSHNHFTKSEDFLFFKNDVNTDLFVMSFLRTSLQVMPVMPLCFSWCSAASLCSCALSHLYRVSKPIFLLVQAAPHRQLLTGHKWGSCDVHMFFYSLVNVFSLSLKSKGVIPSVEVLRLE